MKQSRTDTFDWTSRRGRTPTQGTGPATDHTTKTGIRFISIFNLIKYSMTSIKTNLPNLSQL